MQQMDHRRCRYQQKRTLTVCTHQMASAVICANSKVVNVKNEFYEYNAHYQCY